MRVCTRACFTLRAPQKMVRSSSTPRGCTLAKERGPWTEGNHRKRYECAFDFIRHRGPRHSGPLVVRPPRCAPARLDEVPPQRRPVSAAVWGDSEGPYPHLALRPTYTHTYTHTSEMNQSCTRQSSSVKGRFNHSSVHI